mgnify:CR=1 FL=1
MPHLHLFKGKQFNKLEGFVVNSRKNIVAVNIESLWKEAEKKFAADFSATLTHELLHCTIQKQYRRTRRTEIGEEKVVYSMLNEAWTDEELKFYKKYYK